MENTRNTHWHPLVILLFGTLLGKDLVLGAFEVIHCHAKSLQISSKYFNIFRLRIEIRRRKDKLLQKLLRRMSA